MSPIVLYDGRCGFCDATVQLLLRIDRRGVLRFAPLDGETAAGVTLPEGLDSLVLLEGERVAWYGDAVLGIARHLDWPWRAALALRIVPRTLRDAAYRAFARVRYRIWGRRDACRVPSPAERARFLP